MSYDEDLLVELITDAELTHGQIAERVGISRRTVWSIANGHSRPDLQQKIADTVEGYRQVVVRLAARHMKSVLLRHIEEAVEGQGETARKSRDFLLTTFMKTLADEPAQALQKRHARLLEKENTLADMKFEHNMQFEREAMYTPDDPRFFHSEESYLADLKLCEEEERIEEEIRLEEELRRNAEQSSDEEEVQEEIQEEVQEEVEEEVEEEVKEEVEDELRTGRKMEDPFISGPRRMREASEEAIRSALEAGPIRRRGPRNQ